MIKNTLIREVCDLLEMSDWHHNKKASLIVNTILKSIADALARGEQVRINGLGLFYVAIYQPHHYDARYFYGTKKVVYQERALRPKKRVVVFKPSKSLYKGLPWPI